MSLERESIGGMEAVRYETPDLAGSPKRSSMLANSGLLSMNVQVVSKDGGETNLHAHSGQDAVWFVLAGRAKFYRKTASPSSWGRRTPSSSPRARPTGSSR